MAPKAWLRWYRLVLLISLTTNVQPQNQTDQPPPGDGPPVFEPPFEPYGSGSGSGSGITDEEVDEFYSDDYGYDDDEFHEYSPAHAKKAEFGADLMNVLLQFAENSYSRPMNIYINQTSGEIMEDPVMINCIANLVSIGKITTKSFDAAFILRLQWQDDRVKTVFDYLNMGAHKREHFTYLRLIKKNSMAFLWIPPLYLENSIEEKVHDVLTDNKFATVTSGGMVFYTVRFQATFICTMALQKYPFDTQNCAMKTGLFGYDDFDVKLRWLFGQNKTSATYDGNVLELEEFEVTNVSTTAYTELSNTMVEIDSDGDIVGMNTTILNLNLTLERRLGYHVLQTFIPTTAIVVVSFFSFWIDRNAVPGRVALGITCVLTMQTIASGLRSRLPPVSYYTAMDLWMIVCQAFVILALLEYIFVHFVVFKLPSVRAIANVFDYEPEKKQAFAKIQGEKRRKGEMIERISRVLFPLFFIAFLIIYFVVYMVIKY